MSSLLLGAVQGRAALPNVLGITAASRLAGIARAGFDVVYCHPMDERTERALARVLSPQEPEIEEPPPPAVESPLPPVADRPKPLPRAQAARSEPRSSILLVSAIVVVVAALLFMIVSELRRGAPAAIRVSSSPDEVEAPASSDTSDVETTVPEKLTDEAALAELKERLDECKELAPEDLRQSRSFVAAETLEVKPEFKERRERVRKAFSALIEIRGRMVERQRNYVAYYFDEEGRNQAPAERLQKVAEILAEAPLGGEDCKVLREAFGFELEKGESVVRRWCDGLERLERTAVRRLVPLRPRKRGE